VQALCAAADSVGLCVFGRSVTNINHPMVIDSINAALGTELDHDFLRRMGRETLELEMVFNDRAGFTVEDDELPEFFYEEKLAPTDKTARHHAEEVNAFRRDWLKSVGGGQIALPADSPY
jgi:aldehyde:ferredoxin oxidoreductase